MSTRPFSYLFLHRVALSFSLWLILLFRRYVLFGCFSLLLLLWLFFRYGETFDFDRDLRHLLLRLGIRIFAGFAAEMLLLWLLLTSSTSAASPLLPFSLVEDLATELFKQDLQKVPGLRLGLELGEFHRLHFVLGERRDYDPAFALPEIRIVHMTCSWKIFLVCSLPEKPGNFDGVVRRVDEFLHRFPQNPSHRPWPELAREAANFILKQTGFKLTSSFRFSNS